jgi:hypothetical protein
VLKSAEIKIIANPNLNINNLIRLAKLPMRSLQIYASIRLYVKPEDVMRAYIVKEPKDAPITKNTILTLKVEYRNSSTIPSKLDKYIVHSTSLQDREQIVEDVKSRLKHDAFLLYNKSEALAVYGFLKNYGITPVYLLEIKEDDIYLCKVDSRYV